MNTTFDVLVIILSVLLAVFLTLSITIAIFILKLVKSLRRVVAKGEHMVDSAEAAAEMFKSAAAPAGAFKSIMNIVEVIAKHKKKGA